MKLLLIRHGLTDANASNVIQGHQPTPLNATGLEQARRLGQRLAEAGPCLDALISSDLLRAAQTAGAIAAACDISPQYDANWRERSFGPWEGQTLTEGQIWKAASGEVNPPGAEEVDAFRQRIYSALLGTARRYQKAETIAVVTHGGPCRMVLKMLADGTLPMTDGQRRPQLELIANCSIMHLTYDGSQWDLACLNDVAHLDVRTDADAG